MPDQQAWGKRLRKARVSLELNQTQMAARLGVSRATLIAWESGAQVPSEKYTARLTAVLGGQAAPVPAALDLAALYAAGGRPPTFAEHVLVTAGRIIELAEQITVAAARQKAAGEELGQRAAAEPSRRPKIQQLEDERAERLGQEHPASQPVKSTRRRRGQE